MALPASENTTAKYATYVEAVERDHIRVTAGADISQGDFVVVGNTGGASGQLVWCGVADEDIANGEVGSINVEEGILIQADDLKATEDTFGTFGQDVFFDSSTSEFSDTSTAGYFKVGVLYETKSTDGVIKLEKLRYAVKI